MFVPAVTGYGEVIVSTDDGAFPYIHYHQRGFPLRDAVEAHFPPAFYEGCLFHTFFQARSSLRHMFANEARRECGPS